MTGTYCVCFFVVKMKIALKSLLSKKGVELHKIFWILWDSESTWLTVSYSSSSFKYVCHYVNIYIFYCYHFCSSLCLLSMLIMVRMNDWNAKTASVKGNASSCYLYFSLCLIVDIYWRKKFQLVGRVAICSLTYSSVWAGVTTVIVTSYGCRGWVQNL